MKNDGVSPIIGTILLVGLTVMFVGIVGVALMGGFGMAEPAPIVGVVIGHEGNIITISHMKGEVLPKGSFKILVDGVDRTTDFGVAGNLGPGMKLSWNSWAEPVGTVSMVYTSKTGTSMLLSEKNMGKAGDGFEGKYTIITKISWNKFLDGVIKNNKDSRKLYLGQIYVDNGDYWVCIKNLTTKEKDVLDKLSIQQYLEKNSGHKKYLIKINLSNKTFTKNDMNPAKFKDPWKLSPYPTLGSLYEYEKVVYMCKVAGGTNKRPLRDPSSKDWVKIANI